MENENDPYSRRGHANIASAFHRLAADRFVFNLTRFVYWNVGRSAISDAAFFAVNFWRGQRREGPGDVGRIKTRIVDAGMINRGKSANNSLSNSGYLLESQIAFIELPVTNYGLDNLHDDQANVLRIGSSKRASCRLTGVCQHHYGRLFELRLGSRITEILLVNYFTGLCLTLCLAQKEVQGARAMMLGNEIGYLLRQIDFFRQLNSIRDVAGDNSGTLRGAHVIVRVLALLVLNKVLRGRDLADIVIERSNARQQRICSNRATGVFCQL